MSRFRKRALSQRGSATVEHAGLMVVLGALFAVLVLAMSSSPPTEQTHDLARAIGQKMRCAPRLPGPCWQDPLTEAYGRALGGAVRALAPAPQARTGPAGAPELPVDFRRCRQSGCAAPGPEPGLTASNRLVTDFVSVDDHRRSGDGAEISYWHYRPALAWEWSVVRAGNERIAALAGTPLLDSDVPRLVPLETLDGRNQIRFSALEEPPWRWEVDSAYPG
jgi:hypothetical protein